MFYKHTYDSQRDEHTNERKTHDWRTGASIFINNVWIVSCPMSISLRALHAWDQYVYPLLY